MRKVIEEAVNVFKDCIQSKGFSILILNAPTGYGKTVAGPLLYKACSDAGICYRAIHVLPLRSVVRDFYLCKLLGSFIEFLDESTANSVRAECRESIASQELANVIKSLGLSINDVAYQMGEEMEYEGVRKAPLFDARYVVSTADSFFYNLFRVPVTEIFSSKKHYAIPRLRIYTGFVYFDEAHMIVEESDEESKMFTLFLHSLNILKAMRTPMALASATLPTKLIDEVVQRVDDAITIVMLGARSERSSNRVVVEDKEFTDTVTNISWRTELRGEEEAMKIAIDAASSYRVFIGCDSVKNAINRFRVLVTKLGEEEVAMLNGLMTRADRDKSLKKLRKAKVLVATSVAEAGIDASFNVLITDGTRIPSLIQRSGRVCRYIDEKCEEARIYIVKEFASQELISFVNKHNNICWRLSFDYGGYVGYQRLVDIWTKPSTDSDLESVLRHLAYPLYVSPQLIESKLQEIGGALIRTILAEVTVVNDVSMLNSFTIKEFYMSSLSLDLERVIRLYKKGCIATAIAYSIDDGGRIVNVKDVTKSDRYKELLKCLVEEQWRRCLCYFNLVKSLAKNDMRLTFILRSECYRPGEGVVALV
jgi:CRISPR-associated endonuclease/helicase Cas3